MNRMNGNSGTTILNPEELKGIEVTVEAVAERLQQEFGQPAKNKQPETDNHLGHPSFSLTRLCDVEFQKIEWLIKPLIQMNSLTQIFGDPESLKSFLAMAITFSIAADIEFYGLPVKQKTVIYIAGEGLNGVKMRFLALSIKHGIPLDNLPIYLADMPVAIGDPGSINEALSTIDEVAQTVGEPGLVVIDTVARNFGFGDENSTRDMSSFVSGCDAIKNRYKCAVLLVHHTGHADKSRSRGAMALYAALDAEYRAVRDENGIMTFSCTKMKEGAKPDPLSFEIQGVDLGLYDDEGDVISSAVLERVEYQIPAKKTNQGLGKNQRVAMNILRAMYETHQNNLVKGGFDPENAKVTIDDWAMACKDKGMSRQAFWRVKSGLLEKNEIETNGVYVSLNH